MNGRKTQSGFTVVETLLVLILLAIIGFTGYYVWHSQKNTNKTLSDTNTSSQSVVSNTAKSGSSANDASAKPDNALVIKEWGIKIPNGTSETFTYKLDGAYAQLSTRNLAAKDFDCSGSAAGVIQRATAGDVVYEDGTTAAQAYKESPNTIAHIGNYYYVYTSPQAGCSNDPSVNDYQNSIISEIRALVPLAKASN